MSYSEKTKIASNSEDQSLNYFNSYSIDNIDVSVNSPQIIIDSTDDLQHPLSNPRPPFISTPISILRSGSPNTIRSTERRPSMITFSQESLFYDAQSEFESPTTATGFLRNNHSGLPKKLRRPSILSRISSACSHKAATIPIDHVDFKNAHYIHEGIILCAHVSKKQLALEKNTAARTDRLRLKWKEFRAVITSTGRLELYKPCQCKNNCFSRCLHFIHTEPKHRLELYPAADNSLFEKDRVPSRRKTSSYFLSLLSKLDFSWSLISKHNKYFFQTTSVDVSQQWYRSLYRCLPQHSKKPIPKNVIISVPIFNTTIQLPIKELLRRNDQNVELGKVLEGALTLLNKIKEKPTNWNINTLGLCWKSLVNNQIEWATKLGEESNTFLIDPKLIEKTHELQVRFYEDKVPIPQTPERIEGYILDASKTGKFCQSNTLLYAVTVDHYLFLYQIKSPVPVMKRFATFLLSCIKRPNQTFPNLAPAESSQPRSAVGVIDLLTIKDISEATCHAEEEGDEKHIVHLDQYLFQIKSQSNWKDRIRAIQNYYSIREQPTMEHISKLGSLYVRQSGSKFSTFEKRTCIMTKDGDFCVFKPSKEPGSYPVLDFSFSQRDSYVSSGEACCHYIRGLSEQTPRLFKDGEVITSTQVECCFVIYHNGQKHIFIAKSKTEKESWVQTICC